MFRYVLMATGDPSEAEEIVQEAFLRLVRWRPDSEHATPRNWLFKVARNLIIDRRRRHGPGAGPEPPGAVATPEVALAGKELRRRVLVIIHRLPETQRECLTLREFGDFSYAEIAAHLGISVDQVKVQLFRARQRLRVELRELS